jgi:arginyl-tRNA synthetase
MNDKKEKDLIKLLNSYGEIYKNSAALLQPQLITNYLFKLSQSFHSYYASTKIIDDNINYSRVHLLSAIQRILKDGLNLMNIKAPEDM